MSVEGMISEATAVKEAGVSARTLQRFSEAGYLTVQVKGDGERLYSRPQLAEIFGSFQETSASSTPTEEVHAESSCHAGSSCDTDTTSYYSHAEPAPMVERVASVTTEPTDTKTTPDLAPLNEEIQRLKNLVSLQERILDMKESEIQDLRSQRDWLKTRVEKLEEKGDRDQVLLLSETQALRQLIGLQQKRPSAIRSLLEWLGLGNSESLPALPSNQDIATTGSSQSTIVVNKAANG
jgi:DNA-binding transcriptional MerR regulator